MISPLLAPKYAIGELVELAHRDNHFIDWGEFNPDGEKKVIQKAIPMFGYIVSCRTLSELSGLHLYTVSYGGSPYKFPFNTLLAYEHELTKVKELI